MQKADIVRQLFNGMKLRTNVIIIAALITWIIMDFGDAMIVLLGKETDLPPEAIIAIMSMLIGTGIGGLIVAMTRMFESPQVPADTHERIVDGMMAVITSQSEQIGELLMLAPRPLAQVE